MKQNHHCANIPSFFRVACERFFADLQKRWKPPEIKVAIVHCDCCLPYPILSFTPSYWFIQLQNCFDNRNVETLVSKMYLWKISKICDFWLKTRFFTPKKFFPLKRCPLGSEYGTENRFELRALVKILQRFKTFVIGLNVFLMEICII